MDPGFGIAPLGRGAQRIAGAGPHAGKMIKLISF